MLTGKNTRLRAPERNDIPQWVEWLNDPEVIENLYIAYPLSNADETKWFESMLQSPMELHPLVIEVKTGKSWQMVGNIGFNQVDWRNSNAEIGIFIGEKASWNKGIGTEAMKLLVTHAFETMNLHRIWLRVNQINERAIHCYEKAGFTREGVYREGAFVNGKYVNVVIMSILRTEWKLDLAHEV